MFVGRERELAVLERLYASGQFEFAVVYGRRRVGKTALLSRFIEGKRAIYFSGVESNEKQNLENFSKAVLENSTGIPSGAAFSSFQALLEYVFKLSEQERLVLVIDEYPYIARASKSFASTIQMLIDRCKAASRLMLILCGSSMSYMEDQVLAYKAPLYGRRTAQIKLLPFDFGEACQCIAGFSAEDQALLYGMVGGTPQYLLQLDNRCSVEENIKNTFLEPSSLFFEEPTNLLKQEVRETAVYNAIIAAIAGGASKLTEIASKTGEENSACAVYIKNLIALGILQKETPYGESGTRKTLYSIADPMFRFWYRFVPENSSLIARGAKELAYKRMEPFLPEYMGKVFEELCRQYLWARLLAGDCPVEFISLGRWWGNDPTKKCQTEIDIMGEQDKYTALFAECKWTNEPVDQAVLETLLARGALFPYHSRYFYLFAKRGFTKACIEKAGQLGNVMLVTYPEMRQTWGNA